LIVSTAPGHNPVSIHQMAPPEQDILLTTQLSTSKGWKAELAWLADLQRTVYPHKWLPISREVERRTGKVRRQRPTFYRCATQVENYWWDPDV